MQENPKYGRFKNKDVEEVYDWYSCLVGDIFDSSKYAFTLTKLSWSEFSMCDDSDSDQVADRLPLSLESSSFSDEPDIGHSNASKARSSKCSDNRRKSTSRLEKGKKIWGTCDLDCSRSNG